MGSGDISVADNKDVDRHIAAPLFALEGGILAVNEIA